MRQGDCGEEREAHVGSPSLSLSPTGQTKMMLSHGRQDLAKLQYERGRTKRDPIKVGNKNAYVIPLTLGKLRVAIGIPR